MSDVIQLGYKSMSPTDDPAADKTISQTPDDIDVNGDLERQSVGRIEGGIDAVVLGGGLEGLCAAAMLGRAGLKTILIEAGQRFIEPERRSFAPGYFADDAESLIWRLDPEMVNLLDLYRQGLSFAERRMETFYAFDDGRSLLIKGDWLSSGRAVAQFAEDEAELFSDFLQKAFEAARILRPYFATGEPPENVEPWAEGIVGLSAEQLAMNASENPYLQAIILAETLLGMAARPEEPFSAAALLRRWAGENAGLQGGTGYPIGGVRGLAEALRRSAQVAGVDHRHAAGVKRVLVEWDRVAGVEFTDGAQIRAPIVVSAFPAQQAFDVHIGRSLLDIEFMHRLDRPYPAKSYIKAHLALEKRDVRDILTENRKRRLVYAPPLLALKQAHRLARIASADIGALSPSDGDHQAGVGVMELFSPSAFMDGAAPETGETAAALVGPFAPLSPTASEDEAARWRHSAETMVLKTVGRVDPVLAARIVGVDVKPERAHDLAPREAERARAALAAGVDGYFFCGPEAQIGLGLSGGPGRRAATAAIQYLKKRRHA